MRSQKATSFPKEAEVCSLNAADCAIVADSSLKDLVFKTLSSEVFFAPLLPLIIIKFCRAPVPAWRHRCASCASLLWLSLSNFAVCQRLPGAAAASCASLLWLQKCQMLLLLLSRQLIELS